MPDESTGVPPRDVPGEPTTPGPDPEVVERADPEGVDAPEPSDLEPPVMPEPEPVLEPLPDTKEFEPSPPPPAPTGPAAGGYPPPPPPPPQGQYLPPQAPPAPPKSKVVAGVLAILLGGLGIHKFYLGYTKEGVIMLVATIGLSIVTFGTFSWVVSLIALIEGIIYLTKTDEDFYRTYEVGSRPWF